MKKPKLEPGYSPRFAGQATHQGRRGFDCVFRPTSRSARPTSRLLRLAHSGERGEPRERGPYLSTNQSIRFSAIRNWLVLLTRGNACQADLTATRQLACLNLS
jgi:hypothetical protein